MAKMQNLTNFSIINFYNAWVKMMIFLWKPRKTHGKKDLSSFIKVEVVNLINGALLEHLLWRDLEMLINQNLAKLMCINHATTFLMLRITELSLEFATMITGQFPRPNFKR